LRDAIERRGTSFSDYRDADGQPGENQVHLMVYSRGGEPCPRCGTAIAKYTLGQRGTHYCPTCQPPLPAPLGSGTG
jgi:formamidopyrimidine-DNA glycosylase